MGIGIGTGGRIVRGAASLSSVGSRVCVIATSLGNQQSSATSTTIRRTAQSWIDWASALSNGMIQFPVWHDPTVIAGWEPDGAGTTRSFQGLNCGVSDQTALQIYDRRVSILSYKADIYVLDMGTNDISSQTAEYIHSYRHLMATFLSEQNKPVIVLPILARDASVWAEGGTEQLKALEVNRLSRESMRQIPNVYIYDWNNRFVDQDTDFTPRTDASIDGTHFSGKAAYWVGKDFGNYISQFITFSDGEMASTNELPVFTGTGGSNTDTTGDVPDGYKFERVSGVTAGVSSVGSDYVQLALTTTGAAGESLFYFRTASADTTHTFADEWMMAKCLIETLTASSSVLEIILSFRDRGTAGLTASDGDAKPGANFPPEEFAKLFSTPHNKFVSDSTQYRWRIEVRLDNSVAETVTIKINQPSVKEVADPIIRYGSIT